MDRDLAQMLGTIEGIQGKLRDTREQNRARFPFITSCIDTLRAAGFTASVVFAEEGGNRIGRET